MQHLNYKFLFTSNVNTHTAPVGIPLSWRKTRKRTFHYENRRPAIFFRTEQSINRGRGVQFSRFLCRSAGTQVSSYSGRVSRQSLHMRPFTPPNRFWHWQINLRMPTSKFYYAKSLHNLLFSPCLTLHIRKKWVGRVTKAPSYINQTL